MACVASAPWTRYIQASRSLSFQLEKTSISSPYRLLSCVRSPHASRLQPVGLSCERCRSCLSIAPKFQELIELMTEFDLWKISDSNQLFPSTRYFPWRLSPSIQCRHDPGNHAYSTLNRRRYSQNMVWFLLRSADR